MKKRNQRKRNLGYNENKQKSKKNTKRTKRNRNNK